ncbi:unnamed protein product [Pedinophyceae sp. YPF-701]|nr:unnamed protein product [Pedinophyceae sp. YPF-701]
MPTDSMPENREVHADPPAPPRPEKDEAPLEEIVQDGITYTKGSYVLVKNTDSDGERGVARLEHLLLKGGEASAELRLLRRPTDLPDVRVAPGEEGPAPNELFLTDDLSRVPLSKLDGLATVASSKEHKDAPYVCFRHFNPSTRTLSVEQHPHSGPPVTISNVMEPQSASASGAPPRSTPSSATDAAPPTSASQPPPSSSQPPASGPQEPTSPSAPAKAPARKRDAPAAGKKARNAKRTRTVSTANVASPSAGFGLAHSAAPSSDRMLVLPKDLRSRWSRERYEAAQRSLMDVLVRMGAISPAQALVRPKLREEARKAVGDTGLLDHLLRHMPEACVISGLLVRRMHDQLGHMVYWVESADPSKRTAEVLPPTPAAPQPRAGGESVGGTTGGLPSQYAGSEHSLQAVLSALQQAAHMPSSLPASLPFMSSPPQQLQLPTSPPARPAAPGLVAEERIASLEQRLQALERGSIAAVAALEQHLAAVTARLEEVSQQQLALSAALVHMQQTRLAPGSTGHSNIDLLSALTAAASRPPHSS